MWRGCSACQSGHCTRGGNRLIWVIMIVTRSEAKARELTCYYTGKPCKNGHIAERYVSTAACTICCQSEKVRKQGRAYCERNREKINKRQRTNYAANPEKTRKRNQIYRGANLEKVRKQQRIKTKSLIERRRRQKERAKQGRVAMEVLKQIMDMNPTAGV